MKQRRGNFRGKEEYGSARWGTTEDIKPFIDSNFFNNIYSNSRLTISSTTF